MSPTNMFRPRSVDIQHLTFAGSLAIRVVGPASDTATVLLRGGQLVSWVNPQGREMLHTGPFPWGTALRLRCGGLSVVFAHQEADGQVSYLRFTQNSDWRVHDAWFRWGVPHLTLRLRSREAACQSWPYEFDCFLEMALSSPQLMVSLKVVNVGHKVMQFNAAMQPCFRLENSPDGAWTEVSDGVSLPCAGGRIELNSCGFQDVRVWSPWLHRDRGMQAPDGRRGDALVCVDTATSGQAMALAPGTHWLGSQQMRWLAMQLPN